MKTLLNFLLWGLKIGKWVLVFSLLTAIVFRFVPLPATPLMILRCVEQQFDGKSLNMKSDWVSLDNISPYLPLAVVCAEDQNFLEHSGLDFDAIEQATKYNEKMEKKGKSKRRGASTISQQTAKNVFLWPARSWVRKGMEVYFTFLLEATWNKRRIMEAYLNRIEMGDGIFGAEAAAQFYFKKPAAQLSPEEAALIAACLRNPVQENPAKLTKHLTGYQNHILRQMRHWGMEPLDYDNEDENDNSFNQYRLVFLGGLIALLGLIFIIEKLISKRVAV